MRPFEYVSPSSRAQAVSLLGTAWGNTEILAGGTDLLALMKDDVVAPKRLINIKEIKDLRGVSLSAQGLRIGALTTLGDLADDANVKKNYPALAEALIEAASPQIRNLATLGGNLCQRPRCWYFRNGLGLLPKDETGRELVAAGENRYHAILGNDGPAKFVSPSTVVPVLIAYGAMVRIEGPNGKRELPLEKFFVIPRADRRTRARSATERSRHRSAGPAGNGREGCALRNPPEGSVRLATCARRRRAQDERLQGTNGPGCVGIRRARPLAFTGSRADPPGTAGERGKRAEGCRSRSAARDATEQ